MVGFGLVLILAAVILYMAAARPCLLRWGATSAELAQPLPGDTLVPGATSTSTRAITIHAPPDRVWPWIAQIGQGRGGFYSYTWLENLFGCDIVNAETIHPEWQDITTGMGIQLHPKMPAIPVAIVEAGHALVLGGVGIPEQSIPPVSWAFVLQPAPGNGTRLLIRWRSQTPHNLSGLLCYKYLLEPIHFTMEREMMLGIRGRAERFLVAPGHAGSYAV